MENKMRIIKSYRSNYHLNYKKTYADAKSASRKKYRIVRTVTAAVVTLFFCSATMYAHIVAADPVSNGAAESLVVSEIQTGGCVNATFDSAPLNPPSPCTEDSKKEFITLYNQSAESLDVTGWKVEYLSASGGTTTPLATLDGTVITRTYLLLAHTGYYADTADLHFGESSDSGKLAKSGGHVRITDANGSEQDKVGWGTATQFRNKAAQSPGIGSSIQRKSTESFLLADTDNNFNDFSVVATPSPYGGGYFTNIQPAALPLAPPAPSQEQMPNPVQVPASQPASSPSPSPAATMDSQLQPETLPAPGIGPTPSSIPPSPSPPVTPTIPIPTIPTPTNIPLSPTPQTTPATPTTPVTPVTPVSTLPGPTQPSCEEVLISEILPNPAGTDSGHEYIELHNPTVATIALSACSLQTSSASKIFIFSNISLQPDEYRAFYDKDTGLALPNSAGGTIWLLSGDTEIQTAVYPEGLADNVAWSHVDGNWAQTYSPTPSGANVQMANLPCPAGQERNPETKRCITMVLPASGVATIPPIAVRPVSSSITSSGESGETQKSNESDKPNALAASTLAACKSGQERNLVTNRCRNTTAATASTASGSAAANITACKPGQTRNPTTNRCATNAAVPSTSSTTTCKAGQERNPETNRCRNIVVPATAKACPAGQERNLETGRCKKSTTDSSGSVAKVEDIKTPVSAGSTRWLLPAVAIIGAIAYGMYEWRQEISQKFRRLHSPRKNANLKRQPVQYGSA